MASIEYLTAVEHVAADEQQYLADSDGDVESLNGDIEPYSSPEPRLRYPTPPAALWLRQSGTNMDDSQVISPSTASICDEYDMIDDAETASIASSDRSSGDVSEEQVFDEQPGKPLERHDTFKNTNVSERPERHASNPDVYDSILSEDIETPRQSHWALPHAVESKVVGMSLKMLLLKRPLRIYLWDLSGDTSIQEIDSFKIMAVKLSGALGGNQNVQVIKLPSRPEDQNDADDVVYRAGVVDIHVKRMTYPTDHDTSTAQKCDLMVLYAKHLSFQTPPFYAARVLLEEAHNPCLAIVQNGLESDHKLHPDRACPTVSKQTLDSMAPGKLYNYLETVLGVEESDLAEDVSDIAVKQVSSSLSWPRLLPEQARSWARVLIAICAILNILLIMPFSPIGTPGDQIAIKDALLAHFNDTHVAGFNTTDFAAKSVAIGGNSRFYSKGEAKFSTVLPNHILVSLPKAGFWRRRPQVSSFSIRSVDADIAGNLTELVRGVYCVDVDLSKAYGAINVTLSSRHPLMNVTLTTDLGGKPVRFPGVQRIGTDLSVIATRDLAIFNTKAKALGKMVGNDLVSSYSAAKNMTGQITDRLSADVQAISGRVIRDLQIFTRANRSESASRPKKHISAINITSARLHMRKSLNSFLRAQAKSVIPVKTIASARRKVLAVKEKFRPRAGRKSYHRRKSGTSKMRSKRRNE